MKTRAFPVFLLILNSIFCFAQDWPDWRGINRDGIWSEDGVLEKFDSAQMEPKWSVPVGSGYSGPSVANGKVFLTDLKNDSIQTEGVLCFDEKTGEKIWE